MHDAVVITVSDSCANGSREDLSGPAVAEYLSKQNFRVVAAVIVPDDEAQIRQALVGSAAKAALVVTTGGTGVAARDVTPEATRAVCEREIEGLSERMRSEGAKKTKFAALTRAVCGSRGRSLIVNTPGSPTAAVEALQAIIDVIPHALDLLAGKTSHACKS